MGRVGFSMAGLALITVALSMLIPLLGWFVIAPLTALIIGAGAGWWASKARGYGTAGRGAGAGAIAGLGALFGSIIGLIALAMIAANNPEVQREFQRLLETTQQQNPDQNLEGVSAGAVATVTALFGGGCVGLFNLFLSTIGGLIAGLVYGRNRGAVATAPGGDYAPYPPAGQGLPTMQPPQAPEQERGARIYPEDQRRE